MTWFSRVVPRAPTAFPWGLILLPSGAPVSSSTLVPASPVLYLATTASSSFWGFCLFVWVLLFGFVSFCRRLSNPLFSPASHSPTATNSLRLATRQLGFPRPPARTHRARPCPLPLTAQPARAPADLADIFPPALPGHKFPPQAQVPRWKPRQAPPRRLRDPRPPLGPAAAAPRASAGATAAPGGQRSGRAGPGAAGSGAGAPPGSGGGGAGGSVLTRPTGGGTAGSVRCPCFGDEGGFTTPPAQSSRSEGCTTKTLSRLGHPWIPGLPPWQEKPQVMRCG